MSRPGVSFYQFLPGISDAILPRDHRIYYLFLYFHARHPAKFSLTLCLMPSNNDGSKRLLLRSTVATPAVAREEATIAIDFGPRPHLEMSSSVILDEGRASQNEVMPVRSESPSEYNVAPESPLPLRSTRVTPAMDRLELSSCAMILMSIGFRPRFEKSAALVPCWTPHMDWMRGVDSNSSMSVLKPSSPIGFARMSTTATLDRLKHQLK